MSALNLFHFVSLNFKCSKLLQELSGKNLQMYVSISSVMKQLGVILYLLNGAFWRQISLIVSLYPVKLPNEGRCEMTMGRASLRTCCCVSLMH